MSNMSAETFSTCKLLDVRGLRVSFDAVDVLHGVDLTVHCGRIHALIGESGSGKSVLARSILGLAGRGARTTGSIRFLGRELVGLSEREYRAIRGADIGLVVQDAMSALNPMRTIGEQLVETIACRHPDFRSGASRASRSSRADRHDIALELLRTVGITAPESFPTGLAAMAEESAVDVLLLPPDLSLRRFRVACFDMDSTLIESECIDEMAAFAGAGERISRITRRAMEGLIPFDESLRQRVAALAGSSAEIVTHAVERAVPTPGALDFVDFLTRHGLATYIITGGFEEIATHVARRFGMTGVVCNRLVLEDGRLTGGVRGPAGGKILDADGKRRALEVLAQVNGASLSETIAGGDGANDLQMIAAAGFGFAYHGKPVVMREAPRGVRFGDFSVLKHCFLEAWA